MEYEENNPNARKGNKTYTHDGKNKLTNSRAVSRLAVRLAKKLKVVLLVRTKRIWTKKNLLAKGNLLTKKNPTKRDFLTKKRVPKPLKEHIMNLLIQWQSFPMMDAIVWILLMRQYFLIDELRSSTAWGGIPAFISRIAAAISGNHTESKKIA
ncbi:hypothetical protein N0V90_010045 [Kalmusia sp. IMI 367209]|nr:hypothetical protein N0V90_010045 [Kalmusia sp. IMI 367209]